MAIWNFGEVHTVGNYGSLNPMVSLSLHLSKKHRLTQNVYCKDDGMYQACCSGYVKQTKAAFSQCWAKHKALLNKFFIH